MRAKDFFHNSLLLMSADVKDTKHDAITATHVANIIIFRIKHISNFIQREVFAYLLGSLISYNIICFLLSVGLRNTATSSPWSNNCICYGWWNNLNIRWCAKQNLIKTPNPTTMVSKLILCYATHAFTHTPTDIMSVFTGRYTQTLQLSTETVSDSSLKTDSMSIHTVEQLYSLTQVCDFKISTGRTWLNHTLQLTCTGVLVCHR